METANEALSSQLNWLKKWEDRNYSKRNGLSDLGTWIAKERASLMTNLDLLDYQNEYNSDAEKANRMREAGLNPDLLGVQGSSESADFDASLSDNMPLPSEAALRKQQYALGITNSLKGTFDSALEAYDRFQDIRSKTLLNEMNALRLDDMMRLSANGLATYYYGDIPSFDKNGTSTDILPSYTSPVVNLKGLSKKQLKKLNQYVTGVASSKSFASQRNKNEKDYQQSRYDLASMYSQHGWQESDKDMFGVLKAWNDYVQEVNEKTLEAQKLHSEHDSKYWKNYNTDYEVNADNYQNKYNQDYWNNMNGKTNAFYDTSGKGFDYRKGLFMDTPYSVGNSIIGFGKKTGNFFYDRILKPAKNKFYKKILPYKGTSLGDFGLFLFGGM